MSDTHLSIRTIVILSLALLLLPSMQAVRAEDNPSIGLGELAYELREALGYGMETLAALDVSASTYDNIAEAALAAGIGIHSDRSGLRTAIITLKLDDCPSLPDALARANVAFSVREGLLRLSPHWYLLDDEVAVASDLIRATS